MGTQAADDDDDDRNALIAAYYYHFAYFNFIFEKLPTTPLSKTRSLDSCESAAYLRAARAALHVEGHDDKQQKQQTQCCPHDHLILLRRPRRRQTGWTPRWNGHRHPPSSSLSPPPPHEEPITNDVMLSACACACACASVKLLSSVIKETKR